MKTVALATLAILAFLPNQAGATEVYPGCAVPTPKSSHHTFYVDPEKGSMTGDGSSKKPWHTLAEVLNPSYKLINTMAHGSLYSKGKDPDLHEINPKAPIKPGDTILLMSGDHGSPMIANAFNSDFITIAAAPNQTPVIRFTVMMSTSKWIFQGLKFQEQFPTGGNRNSMPGLVRIGYAEWQGAASDIVFDHDSFSAIDSTAGWTGVEWGTKLFGAAVYSRSPCISVTNSHLFNLWSVIYMQAANGLFKSNLIENFYNDAFDVIGSNITVQNNVVRGNTSTAASTLAYHPDGVQGWTTGGLTNKNLLVDSNVFTHNSDSSGGWMQGVSIFDGKWDGVKIVNNVIVTNAWHGIALYGVDNAIIVNNTLETSDTNTPIWIKVTSGKGGVPSHNPIVRNNISPQLFITAENATIDHNIVSKAVALTLTGANAMAKGITSGTLGAENTVVPGIGAEFVTYNPSGKQYDLRLKSDSKAIGFGSRLLAPPVDVTGKARSVPIDLGAYNH